MKLEEAIKILKEDLEHTKKANECGLATKGEFNKEMEAMEVVLNHLEKYRDLYMQSLANNLNQSLKNREMSNEQLEALNEGWKLEVEKQEKMIELMVEYLNFYGVEDDICTDELSKDCNENCKQCIKQYFEKKAEESE